MIDLLGCGYAKEECYAYCNIVEVDRYDGGSSWPGPRYPWMVVQTCM